MADLNAFEYNIPTPRARIRLGWFAEAWSLFRARPLFWILPVFVSLVISGIADIVIALVIGSHLKDPSVSSPTRSRHDAGDLWYGFLGGEFMFLPIYLVCQGFFAANALPAAFAQLSGSVLIKNDLFRRPTNLGRLLLVQSVCGLFILTGFLIGIVPGFVLVGGLLLAPVFAADRDGFGPALQHSIEAMKSQWLRVTGLGIVLTLLWLFGIAFCGLGLLVIQPLLWLVAAVAYRDLTLPLVVVSPLDYGVTQVDVWPPPPNMNRP